MTMRRPRGPTASGPPAVNLPPATLALILVMLAVFVLRLFLSAGDERVLVLSFALVPAAYWSEGWPVWSLLAAPLTYTLLHGGVAHLAINGVMLAVMGQVLERRLGIPRFLALYAAGALGGAVVHALIGGAPTLPLIGASAAVGGLYGAGQVLHRRGMSLGAQGRTINALAGLFIVINTVCLVLPLIGGVAYAAHLGGFVAGALMSARFQRF